MSAVDSKIRLDEKDRMLLSLLQKNAELSLQALGNKTNLSKMAIHDRIVKLKKAGIILGSEYRIDPSSVRQDFVFIVQLMCSLMGQDQRNIGEKIAKLPGVMSVYQVFGSFDMLIIARRPDKTTARDLVYKMTNMPGVRNATTIVPHTVIKESLNVDTE
jgi:Lrp/AsnC family transcriptional regulator, leucine-responsive regulatory protein